MRDAGKRKVKVRALLLTFLSVVSIIKREPLMNSDGDDSELDISSSDDGEPTSARSLPSSHTHGAGCSHSSKPPPRNAYERS